MIINVKLSLNDEFVENYKKGISVTKVASGWAEIEDTFKFHFQILNNKDNKAFVKYPSVKKGDEYNNIIFPVDSEVRKEVEDTILEELRKHIMKGFHLPEISDVRVHLLNNSSSTSSVKVTAMASIKICGFVINGISVKESNKGPFVQMPQYTIGDDENKTYHDIVYGTSSYAQEAIKKAVLEEYNKKKPELGPKM